MSMQRHLQPTPVANGGDGWKRPVPYLTVGVTGHRLDRLGAANSDTIIPMVDEVLAAIRAATSTLAVPPVLRLLSALADGADTIVADCAVATGWELATVLPFNRADYLADFPEPEHKAAHERLLAASRAVYELPGEHTPAGAPAAYERAGRIMLGQCDLLLAIWDHGPVLGRGGTAQIVAEAVLRDIPVVHIDPTGQQPPMVLWDGLTEHDLGQQTVETVPRAGLDEIPKLLRALLDLPTDPVDIAMLNDFERDRKPRRFLAIAYPMLLSIMRVRSLRWSDLRQPDAGMAEAAIMKTCARILARTGRFGELLRDRVAPRFARADVIAVAVSQVFRSSYVANFALSALAVLLTLMSLALPPHAKPVLVLLELLTIGTVLALTTTGNNRAWHQRWLDSRQLAERLRCLALAAQVGELSLHLSERADEKLTWVQWYARATARELGLPHVRVDTEYLRDVRAGLCDLIDSEVHYLHNDGHRMHHLEHRLHRLGTGLFALTALICLSSLFFEAMLETGAATLPGHYVHLLLVGVTMASAGLPALGAAIYGIRMQGEFAGVAARADALVAHLKALRLVIAEDELRFDTLKRRIMHLTDLLTADLSQWRQTYRARPLSLPG